MLLRISCSGTCPRSSVTCLMLSVIVAGLIGCSPTPDTLQQQDAAEAWIDEHGRSDADRQAEWESAGYGHNPLLD